MSRQPADDYLFEREAVPAWEELFNRKCDLLRNKIAACVFETIFTTEGKYACKKCKCRIKAWRDDREYCVRCSPLPHWTQKIQEIMQEYPSVEECKKETKKTKRARKDACKEPPPMTGDIELGKRIREARQALELRQKDVAVKIFKKDGMHISEASIKAYEKGLAYPPKHILEQIERIIGIECQLR